MQQKEQRGAAALQQPANDISEVSWDDIRIFLGCAEYASFRKASEALGMTGTTAMRRIDRLEAQLGFALFVRHQSGLQLTGEGEHVLRAARSMEQLSFDIFRHAERVSSEVSGVVRVAVTEGVGTFWIMPKLMDFQSANRKLTVDLRCATEAVDVGRLEADIAIHFEKPKNLDLIVTRIGRLHTYPFVSKEYADLYGAPKTVAELKNHRIVLQITPQVDENAYAKVIGVESVAGIVGIRTNSSTGALYAVERGAGIGMLPSCSVALGAPLVPVDIGYKNAFDLWLTYHPDLSRSERHMLVVDWLRRIFDSRTYPCFGDDFIHPKDLAPLMRQALPTVGLRGFVATAPFHDWKNAH
jgi:DNA-binding transcriptional LysR family regulator